VNGLTAAFTGRLGRDPELKYTMAGKKMLTLNVAVDQDQRQTEQKPEVETTWVRVVVWEEKATELEGKLSKGDLVYCEGRLKLEYWTKADGANRSGLSLSAWVVQPMASFRRPVPGGQRRQDLEEVPF
jgi:single-strand DNA-binding protein